MTVNLKTIDDKIEKLQRLRTFLSDPEMLTMLDELGFKPSNGNHQSAPSPTPFIPIPTGDVGLTAKIEAICASMGGPFTQNDVRRRLDMEGFEITAKEPGVAINSVLRRLESKGTIKFHIKGKGRRPNYFVPVESSPS